MDFLRQHELFHPLIQELIEEKGISTAEASLKILPTSVGFFCSTEESPDILIPTYEVLRKYYQHFYRTSNITKADMMEWLQVIPTLHRLATSYVKKITLCDSMLRFELSKNTVDFYYTYKVNKKIMYASVEASLRDFGTYIIEKTS